MDFSISKSLLRKTILQYRRLLDHIVFLERNNQLLLELERFITEKKSQTIHVFLPISRNKEVDVTPLFSTWRAQGRKIMVSKTNFQTRKMNHFFLERETPLKKNTMGIPEPTGGKEADFAEVDIVLVPLLVYDKKKNRIGYGGGFYDQILSETKALKVGLSLSPALDLMTQSDEWDIPLDKIISYK